MDYEKDLGLLASGLSIQYETIEKTSIVCRYIHIGIISFVFSTSLQLILPICSKSLSRLTLYSTITGSQISGGLRLSKES